MTTDSTTLYKLMILYMLNKVNFPLSNIQISSFMLEGEYGNYFKIQEILNTLADDGFIIVLSYRNSTQYRLSNSALDSMDYFTNLLSPTIRDEIDEYLRKNKYDLRSEAGTTSDYTRTPDGDYLVTCMVKEGDTKLIELQCTVPLEEQADAMCIKWKDESHTIYDYIMSRLM